MNVLFNVKYNLCLLTIDKRTLMCSEFFSPPLCLYILKVEVEERGEVMLLEPGLNFAFRPSGSDIAVYYISVS